MVKFLLHFNKKITIETIDDSESTPGLSRQYTRFNSIVKPKLEKIINKKGFGLDNTEFHKTLIENSFEIDSTKDAGGLDVVITLKSINE